MSIFSFLGDILAPFTGGISAIIGNGIDAVSGFFGKNGAGGNILSGINGLFSGGFGGFLNQTGSFLGQVDGFVNSAAKVVDAFINPIAKVMDDLSSVANDIRDKLITPIATVIQGTDKAWTDLVNGLHQDLHQGLQGLVRIPGQIAGALDNIDQVYKQAQAELGTNLEATAKGVIVPGMLHSGAVPLGDLGKYLLPPEDVDASRALYNIPVPLSENQQRLDVQATIKAIRDAANADNSLLGPLIRVIVSTFTIGWGVLGWGENQKDIGFQEANAANPIELLGLGDIMEAWRRGIMAQNDALAEMQRHGINQERALILYENAQFLFSPKEVVELWYRKLIDDQTFDALMDQNNLSPGQRQTLRDMLGFLYGPIDAAGMLARGMIDNDAFQRLAFANHMTPTDAEALIELQTKLPSPQSALKASMRLQAAGEGFLPQALGSAVPDAVQQVYRENQVDGRQAAYDWLEHWRLPDLGTWIDAFFRGLVTREQLDQSADVNGVPRELVDTLIAVEEELPPVWLIPDVIASGVWTAEQAIPQLRKLGFSQANAEVLYNYGASKIKTTNQVAADDLAKLSTGTAKTLYTEGAINAQTYQDILTSHGYGAEAAALTIELTDIEQAAKQRTTFVNDLVAEVRLGVATRDQALSQLYAAGFTNDQVLQAAVKIDAAKAQNTKLPTVAELDAMAKAGLIDQTEWTATMELVGYSAYWTNLLWELKFGAA